MSALFAVVATPSRGPVFGLVSALSLASVLCLRAGGARSNSILFRGWAWLVAAHILLGMGLGLYESSVIYDKVVHVLAFAWAARCLAQSRPSAGVGLIALAALGLGAGWEVFEFTADQGGWFVAQKGLDDTMLDLICDAFGAVMGALSLRSLQPTTALQEAS
ncbi:MAG: hypothetical protein KC912_14965 [Proteobacteria bacterium]|nr:hypothetical protein [Pseudomonadota bacterium]